MSDAQNPPDVCTNRLQDVLRRIRQDLASFAVRPAEIDRDLPSLDLNDVQEAAGMLTEMGLRSSAIRLARQAGDLVSTYFGFLIDTCSQGPKELQELRRIYGATPGFPVDASAETDRRLSIAGRAVQLDQFIEQLQVAELSQRQVQVLAGLKCDASGSGLVPKRRGRPADTDAETDRRHAVAWESGQYKTYLEAATAQGCSEADFRRSLDRHRKRQS